MSRELRVKMDDILEAMTSGGPDPVTSYLDLETGAVVWAIEDDDEVWSEAREEIEKHPERYEEIPRFESREEFDLMRAFAESVDEPDVRDLLLATLGGRGSFGRFREMVWRYPDIDALWFETRRKRLLDEALRWLDSLGIRPVYELRSAPRPVPSPAPRGPAIHLEHVLALGAPEGKTEILEGRIVREIVLPTDSEGRGVFKTLARDLCDYKGVAWRNRLIEGRSEIEMGGIRVRQDGRRVEVSVEVGIEVLRLFRTA